MYLTLLHCISCRFIFPQLKHAKNHIKFVPRPPLRLTLLVEDQAQITFKMESSQGPRPGIPCSTEENGFPKMKIQEGRSGV